MYITSNERISLKTDGKTKKIIYWPSFIPKKILPFNQQTFNSEGFLLKKGVSFNGAFLKDGQQDQKKKSTEF